jgi:hypothetical protein
LLAKAIIRPSGDQPSASLKIFPPVSCVSRGRQVDLVRQPLLRVDHALETLNAAPSRGFIAKRELSGAGAGSARPLIAVRRLRLLLTPAGAALGIAAERELYGWSSAADWLPDLAAGWALMARRTR